MRHILGMTLEQSVWRTFRLEAINALFVAVFLGVVGPFTAPLAVRLGASKLEMGILTAAPFLANLTAGVWASLSQNGSAVRWVVGPHLIWRFLLALVGLIQTSWLLVATSLVAHVAVVAAGPAYGRLMQKVFPPESRGRLMGFIRVGMSAGMLVTVTFSGRLIDQFGAGPVFLAAGACGIIGIIFFGMIREPNRDEAPKPKVGIAAQLRQAAADPFFRRYLLAALLFHGGVLLAVPIYPQFQVQVLDLSNTAIAYLSTAWTAFWLVGYAVFGYLADRLGPRTIVLTAAGCYLGLPLAYAVGTSFPLLLVGHAAQGLADAAMDLGTWAFILQANPERVGAYTSSHMMMVGVRGALAPLIGTGLLSAFGMQPTFLISAALVVGGFAVLWTARATAPASPLEGGHPGSEAKAV